MSDYTLPIVKKSSPALVFFRIFRKSSIFNALRRTDFFSPKWTLSFFGFSSDCVFLAHGLLEQISYQKFGTAFAGAPP